MTNSFFSKLAPKEPKFFPLLKDMSDVMLVASNLLIEFINNYDHSTAIDYYKKIKEQERKGDTISNQIFGELNTTFLAPFDREDINKLANKLDDVTDCINSCAKRMVLYNPAQMPESASELAGLIRDGATCIGKAIDELHLSKKDSQKIKGYCTDLHDIENRADDVYENFIINLFKDGKDDIEIIKLKEIMYELEKATDVAEYVGKIIKTILVKYA